MALTFLNGASPDYLGFNFTTTAALLNQIKTTAVAAGMVSHEDAITASQRLVLKATSNSQDCYLRFTVTDKAGVTNGKELNLQGDLTGNGSSVSSLIALEFLEGADNRLWLTSDEFALALCVESFSGLVKGVYGGWYDRLDNTDAFAWGVGDLGFNFDQKFVAKGFVSNTNWEAISDSFTVSGNPEDLCYPIGGICDHTVCLKPAISYTNTGNTNAAQFAYNGALNAYNSKALVRGDYELKEGLGVNNTYASAGNSAGIGLICRGFVRHVVRGVASLPAKTQVEDGSGYRYLSAGGIGYQGFRIL